MIILETNMEMKPKECGKCNYYWEDTLTGFGYCIANIRRNEKEIDCPRVSFIGYAGYMVNKTKCYCPLKEIV